LAQNSEASPLLAVSNATLYILISLSCVIALSFVLVVISFILPSVSAYIVIPLILFLMLFIGSGFIYRFFGRKLPFVNEDIQ
jgi:hypothetical protein